MAERLSQDEIRVVALVADGLTNVEIAGRLEISEQVVAAHLTRILRKLGLRNRVQVAVWAVKQGLY